MEHLSRGMIKVLESKEASFVSLALENVKVNSSDVFELDFCEPSRACHFTK